MRIAICALLTALILIPGALLGVAAAGIVNATLPGNPTDAIKLALSALSAFIVMFASGAVWGWSLSRVTKRAAGRQMAVAGGVGFALSATFSTLSLGFLEDPFVERHFGPQLPIHNLFTLLFAPAAAIIAGVSGAALGLGSRDRSRARELAWKCTLAGGCAFLVVNLALDGLGLRVGAPDAALRANMVTTTVLGNLAAALAGGAVIGRVFGAPSDA